MLKRVVICEVCIAHYGPLRCNHHSCDVSSFDNEVHNINSHECVLWQNTLFIKIRIEVSAVSLYSAHATTLPSN